MLSFIYQLLLSIWIISAAAADRKSNYDLLLSKQLNIRFTSQKVEVCVLNQTAIQGYALRLQNARH